MDLGCCLLLYFGTPTVQPLLAERQRDGTQGGKSFTRNPGDSPRGSLPGSWTGWLGRRASCLHFPKLLGHLKNSSCILAPGGGVWRGMDLSSPQLPPPFPTTLLCSGSARVWRPRFLKRGRGSATGQQPKSDLRVGRGRCAGERSLF